MSGRAARRVLSGIAAHEEAPGMTKRTLSAWAIALALGASGWPRVALAASRGGAPVAATSRAGSAPPPQRPFSGPSAALPVPAGEPALEPGDLVFQTSRSAQSLFIQRATSSPWSHVGIVDVGPGGPVVIEALGKVSRTPWRAFRARGADGRVLVLRARGLSAAARASAAAAARAFLGRPYDARFGWSDDRIYCSELVVKAYARGPGVSLGALERLGSLRIAGLEPVIAARWGGPVPRELRLVTPARVAADHSLTVVYGRR
jgi:hypothetical protein